MKCCCSWISFILSLCSSSSNVIFFVRRLTGSSCSISCIRSALTTADDAVGTSPWCSSVDLRLAFPFDVRVGLAVYVDCWESDPLAPPPPLWVRAWTLSVGMSVCLSLVCVSVSPSLMVFSHQSKTTRQMLNLCIPMMPFTPGPTCLVWKAS